jgi:hypothetical protein
MFCERCGTQLPVHATFCSSCGKAMRAVPARIAAGRIEGHLRVLAILWLAYSGLRLLGGWFFAAFFAHMGAFWIPHFPFFVSGLMRGAGIFLMGTGLLGLVAGWGLIDRQPWARTLAIILAFFALFHFGLGTALGIYTLWVLLPAESAREYQGSARAM